MNWDENRKRKTLKTPPPNTDTTRSLVSVVAN